MSGLSFGFTKKKEQKVLQTAAINEVEKEETKTDYLTSFDETTSRKKEDKQELVIPLIQGNQWRKPKRPQDLDADAEEGETTAKKPRITIDSELEGADAEAAKELLEEAAQLNGDWETRDGHKALDITIPILMRNKVPDGFETDDKLDVSLRPESSTDAEYEQVPIAAFGKALLRGMGWNEATGIGKKAKVVAPVAAVLRPKGMGLGADRSLVQQLKAGKASKNKDEEELVMKIGAFCIVTGGKHSDYYGMVEGMDEDNARAFVKLTLTGEKIGISQLKLRLVTAKDYKKNSKYINKSKADDYHKETEKQLMEKYERETGKSHKHTHKDEHRDRKRDKHSDRHRDSHRDSPTAKDSHRDSHKESHKHSAKSSKSENGTAQIWLQPYLRVRIIDERYKKGKYFKEKVVIEDVISGQDCICRTEDGKLLEGLSQNMLETVVPKSVPATIMVVSGRHRKKFGELINKDKANYIATVQVLPDRDEVLQLDFDSICDYTGDTQLELDY